MKRLFLAVNGIVQGVGFRPFIHKLVQDYNLKGWVKNTANGVEIEVEGNEEILYKFIEDLQQKKPKLAVIESVDKQFYNELKGYTEFKIVKSTSDTGRFTLISPDVAICEDCLNEMMDINDRRYLFPFINCTNCGPRFTIIKDVPYDRDKTTMKLFKMCEDCENEYKDIEDRRYHAQPDCCYKCGPSLFYRNSYGAILTHDILTHVKKDLKDGKIVAIKGIGGFHLACNARNKDAVEKLRKRKNREEKPFALMCKDIDTVKQLCDCNIFELEHLNSYRRPIVLLKKKSSDFDYISPDNNYLGIMLPYVPLHYLLFENELDVLVMTSANLSDNPIIKDNEEAIEQLKEIADTVLFHNRDIYTRCDDSLIYVIDGNEYFIRRSRGYTPFPIKMNFKSQDILACGAEQKASFTLLKDNYAFLSQHIGDLKNIETLQHYKSQIEHFEKIFGITPAKIVCDYHPDYLSTDYAKTRGEKEEKDVYFVQHHHAHMASCMADNDLDEKVIGITWDGTGSVSYTHL
ncbi:MAG: carbamoyltransferase HypF, partial [Clostridiales bacterium]|nr:carbamoyltransferase HypF [Clostridiales bacterium]